MERNREARRASIVGSNGFNRRRHRTNSLRDSPDEDGGVELQESVRLRERVKKDRDRERERERERERDRDSRERSSRSKRRRAERLMNREDIGGEETSEESVEDDDDEDAENAAATTAGRLLQTAAGSISSHHHHHTNSSSLNQQQNSINSSNNIFGSNHHLQNRKSFPPPGSSSTSSKVFRAVPIWKPGDEIISVSVPRKARSASTKRSHDWISSSSNLNGIAGGAGAVGGEQILRQASSSPARQGLVSTSTPPAAAPTSPSSSNHLFRNKLKPSGNNGGPKLKPPKSSTKPSSSNPEELEIEIAEVLYGLMTQSQTPSSKKDDSREANRSSNDAKSRVCSPISNSTSANNHIPGPNSSPLQTVAPKRKRPRQVQENSSYGARSSAVSAKLEMDQTPKSEISSPNLEKISGSTVENGFDSYLVNSQGQPVQPPVPSATDSMKMDLEFKPEAEVGRSRNFITKEDVSPSNKKESTSVRNDDSICADSRSTMASVSATMIKSNSMVSGAEVQREQKFEIDLMAPPPQTRSSPERETKIRSRDVAVDQKQVLSTVDAESKQMVSKYKEDDKENIAKDQPSNVAAEEREDKGTVESAGSKKEMERSIDLQFDLEKRERNGDALVNATGNKLPQHNQKEQKHEVPLKANKEEPLSEKSGQSKSSLPLPMPMASWPGGLPPMGYMAPLQGVVSMDGSTIAPAPIQPLFSQPRSKRCATHCYIARNIHCLQQFMKINPFLQAAASSASLFGSKPPNLNVIPADLHGNVAVRGLNSAQEKGNSLASSPSHGGKDKGSQTASLADSAQRKQQILIQQALPPVAPNNLMGPTFIFPLNQQQAAVAAASARPNSAKSSGVMAMASSNSTASAGGNVSAAAGAATAMSFNYPTMAANETQYLAILQNNGYPFPIPAVAAPPNYRGTPAQAMPMFNGSFYSSQMIHPSQLHPQQTPTLSTQSQHQNASPSSGSSSSQKQLLSQQQRPQNSGINGGAGSPQNFPSQKSQPSQQLQQPNNQHAHPSRLRHHESEIGSEGSPSRTDSRGSRSSMNIYGQNFVMPIHPQNFALMTPPAALASASPGNGSSNNPSEKKSQQPQQSLAPHSFAMSFGPINGTGSGPGIDITSMAQNHAIFQSLPEPARQNIQIMAATAAAAQAALKNNFRMSEDDKSGRGDSSADTERKSLVPKAQGGGGGGGQSIAFTRSDLVLPDAHVSSVQANNGVEGSIKSISTTATIRSSRPVTPNGSGSSGAMNVQNHIQSQLHQYQQQMLQHKKQTAVSRSKGPATSNRGLTSEHLGSSSAPKFPNPLSGYPQNLVQSNSSVPAQSPQWKNSTRAAPNSQAPSSLASSTSTTLKNLNQQHPRNMTQMQTQISFGGNQKPATTPHGQAPPSSNGAPSPSMMVSSPTTSSISRGASGSPRASASASTNTKMGQSPSLSTQQPKNSPSNPSLKSQSILGNPHVSSSSSTGVKPSMQQQQQLPKNMQQAQLFFSNPYPQTHSPHSTSTSSHSPGPRGFYMQQRWQDQHQQPAQLAQGLPSTSTNDPAKAIAVATSNVKGSGLSSQGIVQAAQFAAQSTGSLLPNGFSYAHPVQVKPAEQKQPAGNDNLHQWQPEKK